jgi:thymidylate synthase (FAD)
MKPWQKLHPLTDKNAFICLVRSMGDDSAIVQAARVSYGKDEQVPKLIDCKDCHKDWGHSYCPTCIGQGKIVNPEWNQQPNKDRQLIRYLMNHSHTTPFEMVEFTFMVQVPMDCWRQWVRHRTANINEYSTRYTEALDFFQVTSPQEWRLQATDNKQGSGGFLEEWPEGFIQNVEFTEDDSYRPTGENPEGTPGGYLSAKEEEFHQSAKQLYQERLAFGVAKEQARKDLPLSTYTRAYWKCDLHNIFNFLRLRMDSHAQLEIRQFANCMFEIVKSVCPVACEAFEDYVLHAKKFSRMEMEVLKTLLQRRALEEPKPSSMTDREWKEFLGKLS